MSSNYSTLDLTRSDAGITTLTLTRADVRNAFNADVIRELRTAFEEIACDETVRAVVLRGEGKSFCAGADLNWMKASVGLSLEENFDDATRMAEMFEAISDCPAPVVAVVHGHALGGGAGLVAAADVAFVNRDAKLGFTEVALGIVPAVISPFVLRKIGETHARRYFVSGEIFDGAEAERIGLAQQAVPLEGLEALTSGYLAAILRAGPVAAREAKRLVSEIEGKSPAGNREHTASLIARLRQSPEGQEGIAAFLGKRKASWVREEGS